MPSRAFSSSRPWSVADTEAGREHFKSKMAALGAKDEFARMKKVRPSKHGVTLVLGDEEAHHTFDTHKDAADYGVALRHEGHTAPMSIRPARKADLG